MSGNRILKNILGYPSLTLLSKDMRVMTISQTVISFYYYVLVYLAFDVFMQMGNQINAAGYSPIWPLYWSNLFSANQEMTINLVRFFFVFTVLAGVFFHKKFWGRLIVFFGIWQMHAVLSSFYHPSHQWYPWLYTSFIFIFLPDIWNGKISPESNKKFLLLIWAAQFVVLLAYTLSGIWKFVALFQQFSAGQVHGFSKDAFAYQLTDWVPRLSAKPEFADFFIDHPEIAWPLYVGSYFLELFAVWTVFRPSLQKIWAISLIIFHFGTVFIMGISFMPSVMILIVLFLNSPFSPEKSSLKQMICDLPAVSQFLLLLKKRG